MALDEFLAQAVEQAQQARLLQQAAGGATTPGSGIFIMGSNNTIVNNVGGSVLTDLQAAEAAGLDPIDRPV